MHIASGETIWGTITLTAIAARIVKIVQSLILGISLSLLLLLLLCLSANVVHAQRVISLNFSNFFPAPHKNSVIMQQWCREVEQRSGGKVRITYFPGGTLSPAVRTYENVVNGTVDIGESCFAYTRGKFPMMEFLDLPLGYRSGAQATKLANAFYEHLRPRELDDVKVLFLHAHGPGILHTKKPVYRLEDLRGMKIRGTGLAAKVVQTLGAVPVGTTMPETYDALRTGIVDGAMAVTEALRGWKWGEVINFTTQNFGSSYTTAMFVVMNKNKWNSLPHDVQQVLEEVSKEWIVRQGMVWDEIDNEGYAFTKNRGNRIITLSKEEDERWAGTVKPLLNEYVRNARNKNLPGDEALRFCLGYLGHSEERHIKKPTLFHSPITFKPPDNNKPSFLREPSPELPPREQPVSKSEDKTKLSLDKVSISDKQTQSTSGNANSILDAGETAMLSVKLTGGGSHGPGSIRAEISSESPGVRTEGTPKIKVASKKKGDQVVVFVQQTLKTTEGFLDRQAILRIKVFGKDSAVLFDEKITLTANPSLPAY
ncbi:MAG: TRAP transporter substrate-binding protein [Syntrophaceae bacterium]